MNKTYYLDDKNNIVSSEEATHIVVQELDEKGQLVNETFAIPESRMNGEVHSEPIPEPSDEVKNILDNYVDRNGNHIFRK